MTPMTREDAARRGIAQPKYVHVRIDGSAPPTTGPTIPGLAHAVVILLLIVGLFVAVGTHGVSVGW